MILSSFLGRAQDKCGLWIEAPKKIILEKELQNFLKNEFDIQGVVIANISPSFFGEYVLKIKKVSVSLGLCQAEYQILASNSYGERESFIQLREAKKIKKFIFNWYQNSAMYQKKCEEILIESLRVDELFCTSSSLVSTPQTENILSDWTYKLDDIARANEDDYSRVKNYFTKNHSSLNIKRLQRLMKARKKYFYE